MTNKLLTILCALFGLFLAVSGFNKLVPIFPMPELPEAQKALLGAMVSLKWLLPLVGLTEIVGGILIAIPKTRALGAIVLLPILIGILCHHVAHDVPKSYLMPLVLLFINCWVIYQNWDKYKPMIA